MSTLSWTQPICDVCWDKKYPNRRASKIKKGYRHEDRCAFCGDPTMSGTYVRVDPTTVPYPREEDG